MEENIRSKMKSLLSTIKRQNPVKSYLTGF